MIRRAIPSVGVALALAFLVPAMFADAKLDETLALVARYNYDQGRQPLLDLETHIRTLPAAEVERRLLDFLRSDASIAGKDFVCRQLSLIGSDASVPVLASMLSSAETVEMARYALERIPGNPSLAALRGALDKAPSRARPGIANTLGIRRDAQAVPALSKLAESPDRVLAESAISALGRIATPPALNTLAALRKKASEPALEASLEAADYLAAGSNRAAALGIYRELAAPATPIMIRIGALQGLSAALGREALPQLLAAMRESDPRAQAAAIRFANAIPGAEVTAALRDELPKLPPASRVRVVTALAARGDRSAVAVIVKAAKDVEAQVRAAALAGLGVIGDAASVSMLAETASSDSAATEERDAARAALDRMRGGDVDKTIVAAIGTARGKVKLEMIRSAGERGIPEAAPVLLAAARDGDPAVRREAIRALRETATGAQVPALLSQLTSTTNEADRRETQAALSAAVRRSSGSHSAELLSAYRSASAPEVKASLLQVMGQSGAKEGLPVLRAALEDSNADLVRAAILALTEWPDEAPLGEMFTFAGRTQNTVHRVLALRAVLKLMDLPTQRPPSESVSMLATVWKLAQQPDEKKGVLSLLQKFPTKEALQIAEAAEADAAVAIEAKAAVQRLRRAVR